MENGSISIVFFGTDEFAHIVLTSLKEAGFDVVAAITKPTPASKLELPPADLGVVAVYGKILPKHILEHFTYGVLNIHPSLLPKYRGPSPIRTAIANGDETTGVTIIRLDSEMDHGPVLTQNVYRVAQNVRHGELRDQLAKLGAEMLIKIIPNYIAGHIETQPQDESLATYTKLLTRDDGEVDLKNDTPELIWNKFRAYETWPGIWFTHKGKRVKILEGTFEDGKFKIQKLQPEGKKPMSLQDFINGYGDPTAPPCPSYK